MGRMSDLMIEMQNTVADDWIRERLEDDALDENSEEYRELADEFYNSQEHLYEQAEFNAELHWLKKNGSSVIHMNFREELEELRKVNDATSVNKRYLVFRMTYAYAVTLLEAFLGDTAKSLISSNNRFFKNSRKIDELKNAKYSLDFLATNEMDAKGLAIKELSNILYHNMPKVKRIFEIILNARIEIDISNLERIMKIRHDIVHRNGKTKEGEPIILDQTQILEMISHIEQFSNELQKLINKNV